MVEEGLISGDFFETALYLLQVLPPLCGFLSLLVALAVKLHAQRRRRAQHDALAPVLLDEKPRATAAARSAKAKPVASSAAVKSPRDAHAVTPHVAPTLYTTQYFDA